MNVHHPRILTLVAILALVMSLAASATAEAQTKKKAKKKASAKETVSLPIQIGLGPSFLFISGPIQDDQAPHYAVQIYAKAILNQAAIKKVKKKVPKKYKKLLGGQSEIRVSHLLVPDSIIISPKTNHTGIYGATWRPIGIDLPILKVPRLTVGAGVLLTYMYIDTELDAAAQAANPKLYNGTTHFFRPGLGLRAELEIPLAESFLISVGWDSGFYVPQELGGDFLSIGEVDRGIWHVGQAYGLLNIRIPYETRL